MNIHTRAIIAGALIAGTANHAAAQKSKTDASRPGRVAVQVAVVEGRFPDQGAVILRRPGNVTPNVIVLSSWNRSADHLAAAAATLTAIMARDGDMPVVAGMFGVPDNQPAPGNEVRAAEKLLKRIASSEPTSIQGVGLGKAGVVKLPGGALRARLRKDGLLRIDQVPQSADSVRGGHSRSRQKPDTTHPQSPASR